MKFYNRCETIEIINRLGKGDEPFLFVVSYDQKKSYVSRLSDISADDVLYSFPSFSNDGGLCADVKRGGVEWNIQPEVYDVYKRKFDIVQRHLHLGNSFLTNLTCRIPVQTNLSLRDVYLRSKALYKIWIKSHLVCFSPEIFVMINNGRISSFPMKGTIDATLPDAEKVLMTNRKEAAEHATIVDLIRNDISMVATDVVVSRYRFVDCLQTNKGEILQTSSEIAGTLADDYRLHMGNVLFSQLPAGSITGAPKVKTVDIIREAEDYDRGFYTGVMGICHNGNMESAVMIRYIEDEGRQLAFKAGGGITACSCCKDEYEEVIQKAYVPIY